MIISMKMHATRQEIDDVRAIVAHFGYKVHSIEGEERVVIGVVGVGDVTACMESVESMPQVEKVVRISAPYKFVSKQFRSGRTRIALHNGVEIGGDEFVVMAGPCSVESEKQIMEAAEGVAKAGAKMLRGGAFKPRTSPYDFQGMEEDGLKLLQKARAATGHGNDYLQCAHQMRRLSLGICRGENKSETFGSRLSALQKQSQNLQGDEANAPPAENIAVQAIVSRRDFLVGWL